MTDSLKLAAQKALEAMKYSVKCIKASTEYAIGNPAFEQAAASMEQAATYMARALSALQHQEEREPASPGAVERAVFDEMQRIEPSWNHYGASRESAVRFALRAVANLQRVAGVVDATPPLLQKEEGDGIARMEAIALSMALIAWKNATTEEWADEPDRLRATLDNASRALSKLATRQGKSHEPGRTGKAGEGG